MVQNIQVKEICSDIYELMGTYRLYQLYSGN